MARPKIIQEDEIKDAHVWMGMSFWRKLSKIAHQKRSSVSALLREAAEEKYGEQQES